MRLKRTKTKLTSPSYDANRGNYITDLGTALPRFRGRARRVNTFESALRSYYERTIFSSLRRVHGPRYKALKPRITRKQYRRTAFDLSGIIQQQRRRAKGVNLSSYLTRSSRKAAILRHHQTTGRTLLTATREDQTTRADQTNPELHDLANSTKKRFVSLPLRHLFQNSKKTRAALKPLKIKEASGAVHRLIQKALIRYSVARRLRDLKKSAKQRKLPREQTLPP